MTGYGRYFLLRIVCKGASFTCWIIALLWVTRTALTLLSETSNMIDRTSSGAGILLVFCLPIGVWWTSPKCLEGKQALWSANCTIVGFRLGHRIFIWATHWRENAQPTFKVDSLQTSLLSFWTRVPVSLARTCRAVSWLVGNRLLCIIYGSLSRFLDNPHGTSLLNLTEYANNVQLYCLIFSWKHAAILIGLLRTRKPYHNRRSHQGWN